jgi:hypothetical protein
MEDREKPTRAEQKAGQEAIRNNLESILASGSAPQMPEMGLPSDRIQHPDTRSMKHYDVQEESFDEAEDTIDAMIEYYLDPLLEKKPHIKRKKKADIIALTHIFFGLKTQQHAIIKLLEEIDIGNMNTKLFDVLERMQGRLESLTKNQLAFRHALEESYKQAMAEERARRDQEPRTVDAKEGEFSVVALPEAGEGMSARGTKNIITAVKPEKVDLKHEHGGLVDARSRPDNPHGGTDSRQEMPKTDDIDDELFLPMHGD